VIARDGHVAVGCGALRRRTASIAEVKRVFVRRDSRGRGIARAIMHELEQLARDAGFSEIWLETGLRQPVATRLYESLGYTRIADFGDYKGDPLSVCYGKRLT
jgi:GNAT superfamily N-acetyltransferase